MRDRPLGMKEEGWSERWRKWLSVGEEQIGMKTGAHHLISYYKLPDNYQAHPLAYWSR